MEEKIYNSALRFLAYRQRSEKEIRDYLNNKLSKKRASLTRHSGEEERRLQNLLVTESGRDSGHGQNDDRESIIEKVIAKLKKQKFINDEEFAKWWVEQRTSFKPRGLGLIKMELRQKGISQDIIDKIFNLKFEIFNEKEIIKKLIDKKLRRLQRLSKQETYQKLGRFLASKGFDWDTIKQSIDEVLSKGV